MDITHAWSIEKYFSFIFLKKFINFVTNFFFILGEGQVKKSLSALRKNGLLIAYVEDICIYFKLQSHYNVLLSVRGTF